jgi:Fic family protein
MYKTPFTITPLILTTSTRIQEILGELKTSTLVKPPLKLRKENKIKTVHHSLAIEGNALTQEQVTALFEKKRVIGPEKDITEIQNALGLYDILERLDPMKEKELLKAHSLLMKGLIKTPGKYRSTNVGIMKGKSVGHIAPQAKMVPGLMKDLFEFLKTPDGLPLLIKACIFHYEFEFIHPFENGNGRMGRLWQQLILMKHSPIFQYLSVEGLIHKKQKQYYKVLEACDKSGDSTVFIEFSLDIIQEVLEGFIKDYRPKKITARDRIQSALETFVRREFSRKQYHEINKSISLPTASRDLASAVKEGLLVRIGDKALTRYKSVKE